MTRTHLTGEALTRVPATLKRRDQSLVLLISTAREGELVRVTIEPQGA